ncbi:Tn3 family transposase [Streptomyces sp. NBC_00264]|uniref:Tn3 family transposase n=1 Tax=unclassified Streptomyces TaxID=2593676 RepID=UPI00225B7247|nr:MULTISPECIES: Tn3 family transposase [unclassified Streptomyces]MCX5158037.1 Tn3 family transposase [Streptomyces sp. NBC_00305]MCX5216560.1 Tn3 family transposase [Streptomyces sp. NBC_00264]
MTSIERTAYPRFKRLITAHELYLFFSPTRDELQWAADATDGDEHLLALLLMLKSYQRMGCFPALEDVPEQVVEFVRRQVELSEGTLPLYRAERTAKHHRGLVRKKVGVKYDQGEARRIAERSIRKEAAAKNRPADLINIALEKVVEAGLELPGFSTFDKMASEIRTEVNVSIREGIHDRMTPVQRAGLLRLLQERDSDGTTLFNRSKKPAKGPTWSHFKSLAKRLEWVDELGDTSVWMESVATGKITDFAGEADAADASELRDYAPIKQIALIACLTHKARMRVRDDLATMFCKRVATKIKKAKEELEEIRLAEREIVEALIGNYRTVLKNIDADGPAHQAVQKAAAMTAEVRHALEGLDDESPGDEVAQRLGGKVSPAVLAMAKALVVQAGGLGAVTKAVEGFGGFVQQYEQIEKVSAHHGNFWEVLLYGQIGRDRAVMFDLAEKLEFTETSEDRRVLDALAHAQRHQSARGEYITAFDEEGKEVDISFATQNWRKAVVDKTRAAQFVRKHFEAMVFTALAEELRTGDVAVVGSEEYADWSRQLLDWEVVKEKLGTYLVEVGLCEEGETAAFDAVSFRRQLEDKLTAAAAAADAGYPDNEGLVIDPETGIPSLKPHRSEGQRPSARRLEQEIKARMPERSLMGIVARTAYFGPVSGNEPKLGDPFGRYVITTFVKGTNMGPYEAARHIPGVSGHELAYTANRHFSIVLLNEAIADLVNAHARLDISQAWGDGTTVAADGTHMDTYLDNLLAETSVRYGKPGGIAYHHISDTYVALFTHFIPCGVWEAVYIIEGLLKNSSEVQPTTVHADTQGQSQPVFALAHLLGFDLMPRIRNWKGLTFYRPSKTTEYVHIGALFGEVGKNVIDWDLIESQFRHLMKVAVSVREGAISSSTLLKRLRSGSKKNATYAAFREVGRVIRTVQLLRYLCDPALRRRVTAATNKTEAFNGFSQWIGFGNRGVIADNDPVEQEKAMKFNALLTNAVIFHNALDIAEIVRQLLEEGWTIEPEDLAHISPYLTGHINRFGEYSTHELGIQPEAYDPKLDVDFTQLRDQDLTAAGLRQAA